MCTLDIQAGPERTENIPGIQVIAELKPKLSYFCISNRVCSNTRTRTPPDFSKWITEMDFHASAHQSSCTVKGYGQLS